MNLWKLLGIDKCNGGGKTDEGYGRLFVGIQNLLGDLPPEEIKLVTGYAGLLGKVAYADMEISEEEIRRMESILKKTLVLTRVRVKPIVDLLSKHRVELFSIEDFIYIRLVNSICAKEQKIELLEAMFSVAAADASISAEEEAVIRVVAKGLLLSHADFVSVKKRFAAHLDVLKT